MIHRTTPEKITSVEPNDFFVFGSNRQGKHGAGAARQALDFGAMPGLGQGFAGQTYAIPTRDYLGFDHIQKKHLFANISLDEIELSINEFLDLAVERTYDDKRFLITAIGRGLAGYKPWRIAPMFSRCIGKENFWLPRSFWKVLS